MGVGASLTHLPAPRTLFPLLSLASILGLSLCLLYLVLSSLTVVFWETLSFLKRKHRVKKFERKGSWWGPRRSGGKGNYVWDVLYESRIYLQ